MMVMPAKSSPLRAADIRQRNENLVLRLIYQARGKGVSQSEVVTSTGLKPPTIFRIFSYLEEAGYIVPLERAAISASNNGMPERKGRRPLAYVAKRDAMFFIGVEFWVEQISIGIFDFQGTSVYSSTDSLSRSENAAQVLEIIVALIEKALSSQGIPRDKVLGVGLGAPGQVNVGSRIVTFYPRIPDMRNFPIAALLEEKLGLKVYLHNNCSIIALSEFRYGKLGEQDSMFMFLLRSGVNGAFIDGGKIYMSPRGNTIEMGHISIDYEGPACICGASGCLEAFMSGLDSCGKGSGRWLFENIEACGESTEATLDAAAGYLSSAVQTVSRLFRPSSFLFITHSGEVAAELAHRVEKKIASRTSLFDEAPPRFFGRPYDPGLAQRGAADLVVDSFLS